nr:penicillin-binding protein activator [uncultured Nitrososphaera sp.]
MTMMAGARLTPTVLLLGLIVSITAANSILYFAPAESRGAYAEVIVTATVTVAAALAIILSYRQVRHNRSHAKSYLSLAAGLILWFCADIIWAGYELVYHVAAPMPSLSDILWLAGYPFFAYNLFATYHEFRSKSSKRVLLASIACNVAFLAYLVPLTAGLLDLSRQEGWLMFAVLAGYPIMNAVLMIPALPILFRLWKERPWSIPWIFKALSLFCIVITDSWFAFIIISPLYEQVWLSSLLFGAEYLLLAGGLLWFNKYLAAAYTDHHGAENNSTASSGLPRHEKSEALFGRNRTTNRTRYLQIAVAVILIGGMLSYGFMTSQVTKSEELVLPAAGSDSVTLVGALLPLTGTRSSYAQEYETALHIAVDDVNDKLAKSGSTSRVGLAIEDTKTDPKVALEKLKVLESKGIRIVVGPATSAEVAAVKQYADEKGILIVSMSSTAPDLSISGDNVFRLVPDDTHQAKAVARQMWDDGVKVVVPMVRADVFGNNLQKFLKQEFEKLGGKVVDGVQYDPPVGDFSSSLHRINFIVWEQELRSLESKVKEAKQQYGSQAVGVYIVAFDEVTPILLQADRHPDLAAVRWYGSDGSAQNINVVKNTDAAAFSVKTHFINPIFGVKKDEAFQSVEGKIADRIGRTPQSYTEVTYDALWVSALTLESQKDDRGTPLRDAFIHAADSYTGATGSTELNDAGDRKSGLYDFWAVKAKDSTSFKWANVATSESE